MNTYEKAMILGDAGRYDSCGPKMCEVNVKSGLGGIYHAKAEHKTCRIFKTLMDNTCKFDCKYCGNSSSCQRKKAAYEPKELSGLFNHLNKRLDVEGLFLSSGIGSDPDKTTENMIESVEDLRYKKGFKGYVHFKVLPGTSYHLMKRAAALATRMSINLEAPNKGVMSELSSCKDYKIDILRRQSWISRFNLKGGQSTQMIINNMSTDKDVLKMAGWEYDKMELRRVYYSSFRPVKGTPLEKEKAEPLSRQNRLYNVDFLRRDYGIDFKELNRIMEDGMLPKEDPKLALAKADFEGRIDINEASYEELIRVPGIGPKTAQNIIAQKRVRRFSDLARYGARVEIAKPFIEIEGKRQMSLMEF